MPKTHIIKEKCAACGKPAIEKRNYQFQGQQYITLECGHSIIRDIGEVADSEYNFETIDGKTPRGYQIEGMKFAEASGLRCLIADEMAVGKTAQAAGILRLHKEQMLPAIIVCKSAVSIQLQKEFFNWAGVAGVVLDNGRAEPWPGIPLYITSFDMLRRFKWLDDPAKHSHIKTVIIDECQQIKNHFSARAKHLQELVKGKPYVIAMSGTPIKNRVGEYFTILNILRPQKFPEFGPFLSQWTNGYGGISRFMIKRFAEETGDFIIRRTREEVLPELPTINRTFRYAELGPEVQEAYDAEMAGFMEAYDEDKGIQIGKDNILAYINRMRHLTGIAKVNPVMAYVEEFLDNETGKLVLFVHHKDVGVILAGRVNELLAKMNLRPCQEFIADYSPDKKYDIINGPDGFAKNDCRVLIASTQAAGEGVDGLQACSDAVLVERQYNPPNEEQAEARFTRLGSKAHQVNFVYQVALGTIDEWFADLVERKRAALGTAFGEDESVSEASIMKELAAVLFKKGMEQWTLSRQMDHRDKGPSVDISF